MIVGLLALMFCVFFWTGYYVGKSTVQVGGQGLPTVVEQPVRVNLAGR
jgi:hypothetical protein